MLTITIKKFISEDGKSIFYKVEAETYEFDTGKGIKEKEEITVDLKKTLCDLVEDIFQPKQESEEINEDIWYAEDQDERWRPISK